MAYEFDCRTAGAMGCGWKARGNSEEELVEKVADHARKKHNVNATETIKNYVRSTIRQR
jgi:predicted small metal-binding protein